METRYNKKENVKRTPVITADGSITFRIEELNEQYHSVNGAVTESLYVFIEKGLKEHPGRSLNVFEVGFGTGLNAFLSLVHAKNNDLRIDYTTIEMYPLDVNEIASLNFSALFPDEFINYQQNIHDAGWGDYAGIAKEFNLRKIYGDLTSYWFDLFYDVVFFDAFSPKVQPELWTPAVFQSIFNAMNKNGILVTYSASGHVKRAMESAGFQVEKLEGPPGKRHMLRARKII